MVRTERLTAIIEREDDGFVALCPELDVASEGAVIGHLVQNALFVGVDLERYFQFHPRRGRALRDDAHEARRQWKKFQMISTLPERDQKAVARLINSLVAAGASRKNGSMGEHNGR